MNLKKPKFWNLKRPNIFAYLLFPFSILIGLFSKLKRSTVCKSLKIKTICVGNIYIGGTGKTSLSIKINEILTKRKKKSCFVKKFYKNQYDEQKLLERRGRLFLSEKRLNALKNAQNENYEFAIIDDGLQDKSLDYDVRFVCFNSINWIGNGMTIPSGPLREPINVLKKYQHVFLNGNLENTNSIKEQLYKINPEINIHIGKYEPVNLDEFDKGENYLVFSGIGNHGTFISMLKNNKFKISKNYEYPDHYEYKNQDIDKILNEASILNCKILTTEKDYLRLKNNKNSYKIKYIKSELKIIDEEKFIKSIM